MAIYDNIWEEIKSEDLKSGGQGKIIKVKYIGEGCDNISKDDVYALKLLKNQKDMERRERMFREVNNLLTLNHPNILKIKYYKIREFGDIKEKLYFVTPYVNGNNLEENILNNDYNFDEIISSFMIILDAVSYCHNSGIIHRDLKPDNIMCKNGNIQDIVLIDFGISFNNNLNESTLTEINQQMGNRFLNLPEMQTKDDFSKRTAVSDITQLCGILIFMLTKQIPSTLIDGTGAMPHQRENFKVAIEKLIIEPKKSVKMKIIFDRAFQITVHNRYQSCESLKHDILELMNCTDSNKIQELNIDNIEKQLADRAISYNASAMKLLEDISSIIMQAHADVYKMFENYLLSFQMGFERNYQEYYIKNTMGFVEKSTNKKIVPQFFIRFLGNEILLEVKTDNNNNEILRLPLSKVTLNTEGIKEQIKKVYFQLINDKLKEN